MLAVGIIDVQNDFMLPNGKLYVSTAELIIRRLNYLLQWAKTMRQASGNLNIPYFFTQDNHFGEDPELKVNGGDFPPHCMAGTFGQANIMEVPTDGGVVFTKGCYDVWDTTRGRPEELERYLRQNSYLSLSTFPKIDQVFLGGVVGNICVAAAARGFRKRGVSVTIIEDSVVWLDLSADNNEVVCRKELVELGVKFMPSLDGYSIDRVA